jgi:tetratricopeptide (TPR) repeat protein
MEAEELFREACDADAQGDHGKAATKFKRLVAIASDARYHIAYGWCLQQLNHWQQSAAELERGIALKPKYAEADARVMLAESYLRGGDKARAVQQWRIVTAMVPSYPSYEAPINAAKAALHAAA